MRDVSNTVSPFALVAVALVAVAIGVYGLVAGSLAS